MVIRDAIKNAIASLREGSVENAVFDAHQLARRAFKMTATEIVINHGSTPPENELKIFGEYVARRKSGEPLQYILGTQEFMSLEFFVNPDVLIPRQDTETLVEYVLEHKKSSGMLLLDIGTGTGCIPLSIAHYNSRAFVRGLDISAKAVETAMRNSEKLGLSERASFEKLDIMTQIPTGKYDVVTSNPPYIKSGEIAGLQTEVKDFEPARALDGGTDGLDFYRRIVDIAPNFLQKNGLLIFEIGNEQGEDVKNLMKDFHDVKIIKDLCGNDRVVCGLL